MRIVIKEPLPEGDHIYDERAVIARLSVHPSDVRHCAEAAHLLLRQVGGGEMDIRKWVDLYRSEDFFLYEPENLAHHLSSKAEYLGMTERDILFSALDNRKLLRFDSLDLYPARDPSRVPASEHMRAWEKRIDDRKKARNSGENERS